MRGFSCVFGLLLFAAGCGASSRPATNVAPHSDAMVVAGKPAGTNAVIVKAVGYGAGTIDIGDPAQTTCVTYDWDDSLHYSQVCWAYVSTSSVAVSAAARPGSRLTGWSGACEAASGGSCTLATDRDQLVNVGFGPDAGAPKSEFTLTVHVLGPNINLRPTVSTDRDIGLSCHFSEDVRYAYVCSATVPNLTPPIAFTLTMAADPAQPDEIFAGWGGATCSGTAPCSITMDRDVGVTAGFARVRPSSCTAVTHNIVGSDDVSLNYAGSSTYTDSYFRAYRNPPNFDITGWVKFDTSAIPASARIDALSLRAYAELVAQSPAVQLSFSAAGDWNRASATTTLLPRSQAVSSTTSPAPGWNTFPVDPLARDWSAEIQRGWVTLGVTNPNVSYSYSYYSGVESANPPVLVITTCESGDSTVTCALGTADCDANAANGCETSVATDPANCGGCGVVCPAVANGTPVCASNGCGVACNPGYHLSSGSCVPDAAYRRVFVTSETYTGNMGGLAGADAKCQSLAQSAGLSGTYLAWLSTSTSSPSTRFTRSTVPYVLVDGTVIARDWAQLTSGTLLAPISLTERGGLPATTSNLCLPGQPAVWTDTTPAGTLVDAVSNCLDWTSTTSPNGSTVWGYASAVAYPGAWTQYCSGGGTWCASAFPIYCFEQ